MITQILCCLLHQRPGHGLDQRPVRILVLARPFEHVAAGDDLATQISGLAGNAAQFLEPIVVGLEFVIRDRIVLDGHLGRNRIAAVAILEMAPQIVIGRKQAPGYAVPVRARPADPRARQEGAEPPQRQRGFRRRVPQRYRLGLRILEQFLAHRVFEIVAHGGKREILACRTVGAALEPDDLEPGLGQFAGENAAGKPDADADRIDFLEHRGHCCFSSHAWRDQPSQFGVSCTIRPPTMVISEWVSGMLLSSVTSGSALTTARSASLPTSSEPFLFSSNVR